MWRLLTNRRVLQAGAIMAVLLVVALWPEATPVEVASVTRGAMAVTVDQQGETRVHHRYVVRAPVSGTAERLDLQPGNGVQRGQTVVTRVWPDPAPAIDAAARRDAATELAASQELLTQRRREEQRARDVLELVTGELAREQARLDAGLSTQQSLEARRSLVASAEEMVSAAQYATATTQAAVERAQVRLAPQRLAPVGRVLERVAPVDGVVISIAFDAETVVAAGDPLLEIGDPSHLEIVADLLAADAQKVKPGMRVAVEHWGGDTPLAGRVERVEPQAFAKVSSEGVEERRVNVIIDFEDDRAAWRAMGDGFRVQARIAIWEAEDVVRVPVDALFRAGDQWAVYVVQGNRARRVLIDVGERTPTDAEVRKGLTAGQQVVLHPPETLTDNARVVVTASSP